MAQAKTKPKPRGKAKADNTPAAAGASGAGGAVTESETVLTGQVVASRALFDQFRKAAASLSNSGAKMDSCIRVMWTSVFEAVKAANEEAFEAAMADVGALNRLFAELVAKEKDSIGESQRKNSLSAAMSSYKAKMIHPSTRIGVTISSSGVTSLAKFTKDDDSGFSRYNKGELMCPNPKAMKFSEFIEGSFVAWKPPKVEKTDLEKSLAALKKCYETQAWAAKQGLPGVNMDEAITEIKSDIERLAKESGEKIVIPNFDKTEAKEAVSIISAFLPGKSD